MDNLFLKIGWISGADWKCDYVEMCVCTIFAPEKQLVPKYLAVVYCNNLLVWYLFQVESLTACLYVLNSCKELVSRSYFTHSMRNSMVYGRCKDKLDLVLAFKEPRSRSGDLEKAYLRFKAQAWWLAECSMPGPTTLTPTFTPPTSLACMPGHKTSWSWLLTLTFQVSEGCWFNLTVIFFLML